MDNKIHKSNCLVKSYLSETAIQNWIDDIKKRGYRLTFFNTQYDLINKRLIYTAVMELEECKS